MAQSTMINVGTDFDLGLFAQKLAETWQAKGFTVQVANLGNSVSIVFDKGVGGINMLLGLGQGITANCTVNNGTMIINYTDGDWTGKVIGIVVGWLLCLVPMVCSIIGSVRQLGLPKRIGNDALMIASNLSSVQC